MNLPTNPTMLAKFLTFTPGLFGAAMLLAALPAHAAPPVDDTSCQRLIPRGDEGLKLDASANYCLGGDLKIRDRPAFFPDGRSGLPTESVAITADNVTVDFGGHSVRSGDVTAGIRIRPKGNNTYQPGHTPRQPQQITIRNGTIRAVSSNAIDAGFDQLSIPSDMGDPLEGFSQGGMSKEELDDAYNTAVRLNTRYFQRQLALRPERSLDYQQRGIRIENMHINARQGKVASRARSGAINIQGAGTVIRNCVIETDAGTALWIFGPNAVIENNTIIVHGAAPLRAADAPIRLHQADGAVIRGNRFIMKDNAAHRGISVFDSGTIVLQDNTFYGLTEKDEVAKAFTGTLEMKETGNHVESAWKAAFGITE